MNQNIVAGSKIIVAATGLILSFFTVIDLGLFLSYSKGNNAKDRNEDPWSLGLFYNMFLLSLFILPHTFLALPQVKELHKKFNIQDVQRSIYIIITCLTLQVVMKSWNPINEIILWQVQSNKISWIFSAAHFFSWLCIYIGSICMDVNEMIGLKQVYYSINNLPNPMNCKSLELQQLYSHMRHPSFIGFMIILWFVPLMTLDRLLLASVLSLYMFFSWNTDEVDYRYQKIQFCKKFK